jgi:hypothetical protein
VKTTAYMDGYFSTSLLIDKENYSEDSTDPTYLKSMLYMRMVDKRSNAGDVSKIISVSSDLHLIEKDVNPNDYEVKIQKQNPFNSFKK